MTALVTGGAGFLGGHIVSALLARHEEVRVLDPAAPPERMPPHLIWQRGSILDADALAAAMAGAETVYHVAGLPHFWVKPRSLHNSVNHHGTLAVLKAAGAAKVKRLVHTSTEAVLMPCGEESGIIDHTTTPRLAQMPGPYTRAKLLAEQAAYQAAQEGLPVVIASPTALIGPGDKGLSPPTRMILDLLNGRYPAILESLINFADVRDVAKGMIAAAEQGVIGRRYILGGTSIYLSKFLVLLQKLSGLPMPRRAVPYWMALASARLTQGVAQLTGKPPAATPEAVRLTRFANDFSLTAAEHDLAYWPRPLAESLEDAIADLAARDLLTRPLRRRAT